MTGVLKLKHEIDKQEFFEKMQKLYCTQDAEYYVERYKNAVDQYAEIFGDQAQELFIFSAPGRTEVGGNHTDHQHGRVLAAAVNLDVIAVVSFSNENTVKIKSQGYDMNVVDLATLEPVENENGKSNALIRGVAARFKQLGYNIGGFCAYTTSNVLKGSGLSSSAAFEVLVGTILNHMYNDGKISAVEIAQISQYAENEFFGKPCGLMDQTACSVGGFITIDFKDTQNPVVEKIDFDFAHSGYKLCIVDTGGNHADLTPDYAAVPAEMKSVAHIFSKEFLRDVDENEFYERISEIREKTGDRAVLRAIHFFGDNNRVVDQVKALKNNDFEQFKKLIVESGNSSYKYLQNVFSTIATSEQGISLALALSEKLLNGKGAYRVHGGGFAGTIQAFVPQDTVEEYVCAMQKVFGKSSVHILSVRDNGGIKVL